MSNSAMNGREKVRRQMAVFGSYSGSATVSSEIRVETSNSENWKKKQLTSKLRLIWRVQIFFTKGSILSPPIVNLGNNLSVSENKE